MAWVRRNMLWQRLLAVAFSVALLGYGVMTLGAEISISQNSAEAVGKVVGVQSFGRGPDTITVEFPTPAGVVRADVEDVGYNVGDEVAVQYDRDHPTRARFKGSHGQVLAGVLFGGLGVLFAYGAFKPRWAFRKRG